MTPDIAGNAFAGSVIIKFDTTEQVSELKLHSDGLTIDDYKIVDSVASPITASMVEKPLYQTLVFTGSFPKGSYSIMLEFSAKFKPGQFTGFYKTSYKSKAGEVKDLVTTKFEPTYARQAFPCFDETFHKATFDISIVHPDTLTALSNEAMKSSVPVDGKPGWNVTTFVTTPLMPTYTVAYVVSDFVYTETKTASSKPVRVYSRPDEIEKTKYAADVAADVLDLYEAWTGIPYKLSKLDLIGIPGFISGAMVSFYCSFLAYCSHSYL